MQMQDKKKTIKKNTKVAWLAKDSKHKSIYQMDD
jgi:hypothetical protein